MFLKFDNSRKFFGVSWIRWLIGVRFFKVWYKSVGYIYAYIYEFKEYILKSCLLWI